jgi:hypothetical protein
MMLLLRRALVLQQFYAAIMGARQLVRQKFYEQYSCAMLVPALRTLVKEDYNTGRVS